MTLIRTWAPFFPSHIRMRGRAYQQEGRVHRVAPEDGEAFRAHVTGEQSYTTTLYIEGDAPTASCTCAYFEGGRFCKHIWALIVDVQTNPDAASNNGDGRATLEQIESLAPHFPKARRRPGATGVGQTPAPPRQAEPDWVGRLSLLRSASTAVADASTLDPLQQQRQVLYVVVPELCHRHNGLVIDLRQRTPTASGWSKSKALRLTREAAAALDDPEDRRLCALLMGATWVDMVETGADYRVSRAHASYRLAPGAMRTMLFDMIDTGRAFIDLDGDEHPLGREDDDAPPWVLWVVGRWSEGRPAGGGSRELIVKAELRRGGQRMAIDHPTLAITGPEGLIIADGTAAALDDRDASRWVSQFRDDLRLRGEIKPIIVPESDVPRFLDRLYVLAQLPELDLPDDVGRSERRVAPVPQLELSTGQQAMAGLAGVPRATLLARLWFDYDGQRVSPNQPGRFLTIEASDTADLTATPTPAAASRTTDELLADAFAELDEPTGESADAELTPVHGTLIRRDHRIEHDAMRLLATLGVRSLPSASGGVAGPPTLTLPARDMAAVTRELLSRGWVVTADQRAIAAPAAPTLSVSSGIDWFEVRGSVSYQTADGEQIVDLPEVLAAIRAGRSVIRLGDGTHGLLPEAWLAQHRLLTAMGVVEADHLRFSASQAVLLDAMLGRDDGVAVDERFAAIRERVDRFTGIEPRDPAPTFTGTLRTYQREGLGWLAFLRWLGCGGVLADDMGLGKTIQVLAMLDGRRDGGAEARRHEGQEEKAPCLPSLIVVPRSVVFNWIDEAGRFAPHLRVAAYTGADRHQLRDAFADHDVIVTSYGLMRRDIEELMNHEFDYVVLDEAQAIKNPASQSAKAARLLRARHRLALTGTPVENHLGDLWSIFEFLNPGMLGLNARFAELVKAPSAPGMARSARRRDEEDVAAQIGKSLRPFILRRTKSQVLRDLPAKTEQTLLCQMEGAQQQTYEELRAFYRANLLGKLEFAQTGGENQRLAGKSAIMVLEALLRLRQAACHPGLIDPSRVDEPSAKLDVLLDRVTDLIDEGHKALVFSQFTSMLAIVRRRLDERGVIYEYMDGQTRDRRAPVERFQNDPSIPLFLISLKTGGLGLNLTAAGYVFILDPWWNPAAEQQAIDRAHRIGQTQHVVAYRLICENTVEQRIAELQQKKKRLAEAIVGAQTGLLQQLTREDLEKLLA